MASGNKTAAQAATAKCTKHIVSYVLTVYTCSCHENNIANIAPVMPSSEGKFLKWGIHMLLADRVKYIHLYSTEYQVVQYITHIIQARKASQ